MSNLKLLKILQKNLKFEDPYYHFANNTNPFQFYFNDNDYLIHLTSIHGWNKRPDMRRIQIKPNIRNFIIKKSSYDFIFAILGYDFETNNFVSWPTEVVFTKFSSGKSLYTNKSIFDNSANNGIGYWSNNSIDTQSVAFREISINEFLKKPIKKKINYNNKNIVYLCLDHKTLAKSKFNKNIQNLENQLLVKKNNKKSQSWDRIEYIVVLDLYFKIKNKKLKDTKNSKEILLAHELLSKRNKEEKLTIRTLNSLYLRIQNFKACDPEWKGKGLEGGAGGRTKIIFDQFKNNLNLLNDEVSKIYNKHGFNNSKVISTNFIKYSEETETKSQILIPLNLVDEYIEAQNLKDRASNIHKLTLKKFVKFIKNIDDKPLFNKNTVDLFFRGKNNNYIVEVKSINQNNVKSQLRSAIVQLIEYEYFHKNVEKNPLFFPKNIVKIVLLSENPNAFLDKQFTYSYSNFCNFYKIQLIYLDNNVFLKIENNKIIKVDFNEQ